MKITDDMIHAGALAADVTLTEARKVIEAAMWSSADAYQEQIWKEQAIQLMAALDVEKRKNAAPQPVPVAVKALEWHEYKGLVGYKLCASDIFGNEFARVDLKPGVTEAQIEAFKREKQADYEARISSVLSAQVQDVAGPKVRTIMTQENIPTPVSSLSGSECQYAADMGMPEHHCAVPCVYEDKGFSAGIEQAARIAETYDETDTLAAPKAIASAIRALRAKP